MPERIPHLGEAELEIMMILWSAEEPVPSTWIHKRLLESRNWSLSTLMYSLSRLAEKQVVLCDRSTRSNLYSPLISEAEYKQSVSRSFLHRLYGNSLPGLVMSLYDGKAISRADLDELRAFLDELEGETKND